DQNLDRFFVLIERRRSQLHQSLFGSGFRRPHVNDFALQMKFVTGTHWTQPVDLAAGADDAAGRFDLAVGEKSHGHCRGMPAAGSQSMEERSVRGLFIEMERLWVKLSGK